MKILKLFLKIASILPMILSVSVAEAQDHPQTFTDPVALLHEVAKTYAASPETFRMEFITESAITDELRHEWRKTYHTAIKGPGKLYRIETRSPFGSYIQDYDGVYEWVYLVEGKVYVKRPLLQDQPKFSTVYYFGNSELAQAWSERTWLESEAAQYKHATMLPEETIVIEGRSYSCYVVHVTNNDSTREPDKELTWDTTYWIDKDALVFRKEVNHENTYMSESSTVHIPFHQDTTTLYPVTDFHPQTTAEIFKFTPPSDAKEVAKLEPDYAPASSGPETTMVGQAAPDTTFTTTDGKKVSLSSFRGKPLLIDFWATWCGPCLLSMPSLNSIYTAAKDKGLAVVTFDQDNSPDDATAYLARHHYAWTNYHDAEEKVRKAFKKQGIPFAVLIDAQGKIIYYDFGGDEAALRKAIAALGPEFASIAPTSTKESSGH